MKTIKTISLILFVSVILFSCKKKESINSPEITITELGYQNSKVSYPGGDLHIEASILADGKIAGILVELHPGSEHGLKQTTGFPLISWEFDSTYTGKYSGVKNTEFHEHIEIPADADTGYYHFHFIVTDMEGNQSVVEDEVHIIFPADTVAPVITVNTSPSSGQVFSTGQTITMLHTHDFHDPSSVEFQAQLAVGASSDNDQPSPKPIIWNSGNYYLLIKSPDAYSGKVGFSNRYPIVINL